MYRAGAPVLRNAIQGFHPPEQDANLFLPKRSFQHVRRVAGRRFNYRTYDARGCIYDHDDIRVFHVKVGQDIQGFAAVRADR